MQEYYPVFKQSNRENVIFLLNLKNLHMGNSTGVKEWLLDSAKVIRSGEATEKDRSD